jgi:pyridoxal phosphate enzyme (YggS family)
MDEVERIGANVEAVRRRVAGAAERAGRDPVDITLIAVTKTHPADAIEAAVRKGITDCGENRVQEAAAKIEALRGRGVRPRWHLVGHLQRNKVARALELFDIIHSVDSIALAEAISARARTPVAVLLEVNVAGEESKHGVTPERAAELAEAFGGHPGIRLEGLMTVAPQVRDPEEVRPVFRTLRQLRDRLGLRELSMGMTDDFEVAIEEGATMVRVGRAIFDPREAT